MAQNRQPIWTKEPNLGTGNNTTMAPTLTTAAADVTGVNANNLLVLTGSPDDTYVTGLRFKPLGTNVATVARIYLNNGATNTTAGNNELIGEVSLPATTASSVAATVEVPWYWGELLNTGWCLYVGLGTTVAAGWRVTKMDARNY
jgi:hypothetical protein